MEEETGAYLVYACERSYKLRPWDGTSWEKSCDREKWRYTVEGEGGKFVVRDRVEDFFVAVHRAMVGVG